MTKKSSNHEKHIFLSMSQPRGHRSTTSRKKGKTNHTMPSRVKGKPLGTSQSGHLDNKYKALYQKFIIDNHDVFSKDHFDLGFVPQWEHLIEPIYPKPQPFTKQFCTSLKDQIQLDEIARNLEAQESSDLNPHLEIHQSSWSGNQVVPTFVGYRIFGSRIWFEIQIVKPLVISMN